MDNNKLFRIILIVLLGLSGLLSILFFMDVVGEGILISWCYILLGIATLVAIVFPIITMAQNPKNAKSTLIGVGAIALVCVIGYFLAGNEPHIDLEGNMLADAATSQQSEAGLIAFYILAVCAIGSIIFAEVSKIFK